LSYIVPFQLIQFIEKVKNGEQVDIEEFSSSKPKASKTSPSSTPQKQQLVKVKKTKKVPVVTAPQILTPLPYSMLQKDSKSFKHQHLQLGKNQLTPFLFDYLSSAEMLPSFTITQAIELERLLVRNPDIPTPDQVRLFSNI
jgi:hypothetical protein